MHSLYSFLRSYIWQSTSATESNDSTLRELDARRAEQVQAQAGHGNTSLVTSVTETGAKLNGICPSRLPSRFWDGHLLYYVCSDLHRQLEGQGKDRINDCSAFALSDSLTNAS